MPDLALTHTVKVTEVMSTKHSVFKNSGILKLCFVSFQHKWIYFTCQIFKCMINFTHTKCFVSKESRPMGLLFWNSTQFLVTLTIHVPCEWRMWKLCVHRDPIEEWQVLSSKLAYFGVFEHCDFCVGLPQILPPQLIPNRLRSVDNFQGSTDTSHSRSYGGCARIHASCHWVVWVDPLQIRYVFGIMLVYCFLPFCNI